MIRQEVPVGVEVVEPLLISLQRQDAQPLCIQIIFVDKRVLLWILPGPAQGEVLVRRQVEPLTEISIRAAVVDVRVWELEKAGVVEPHNGRFAGCHERNSKK